MSRPFRYGFETIPWEQCARFVQQCEAKNRSLSAKRVETIARAVDERRFFTTHQGIAFDAKGNLLDGQHRLAAHAKAKTDYIGLVCHYTEQAYAEQVMSVFDSGRTRTTADGLAIGGIMPKDDSKDMTAVCHVFALFIDRSHQMDIQETAEFYKRHRDSIRWSVGALRRCGAYIRAAFALAWEVDAKKTAELAMQIAAGVGVPGSAAALWNRASAAGSLTANGGRTTRLDVAKRALRILHAHVAGEPAPSKLYTEETSLQWFLAQAKITAAPVSQEVPRMSILEERILAAIPKDGTHLRDIVKACGKTQPCISQHLARMEHAGIVVKPSIGFYKRAA